MACLCVNRCSDSWVHTGHRAVVTLLSENTHVPYMYILYKLTHLFDTLELGYKRLCSNTTNCKCSAVYLRAGVEYDWPNEHSTTDTHEAAKCTSSSPHPQGQLACLG